MPLVRDRVPPDGRLYFCHLNGENLTLHTGKRGRNLRSPEELTEVLNETPAGLIVFEDRMWNELPQELSRKFTPRPFRLGGKRLLAAHWGNP